LPAEIAVCLQAEKLVLLSDVSGIYLDPDDPAQRSRGFRFPEAEAQIASAARLAG